MATINTTMVKDELRVVSKKGIAVDFKPYRSVTNDDKRRLAAIQQAVKRIDELDAKQDLYGTCSLYFKSLPRGRTLRELWRGGGLVISFWPNSPRGCCGSTHKNNKDITIASWCLDTQGVSMVAATLIHEVAHVAGAPGKDSHAAERAVKKCGFDAEYDPLLMSDLHLYSNLLNRMG